VVEDKSLLGAWVDAKESNERDRLLERINDKYLPAVLIVTAFAAELISHPTKYAVAGALKWATGSEVDEHISELVTAFLLGLGLWLLWRLFSRPEKKKTGENA
jgi:hypothetical protein